MKQLKEDVLIAEKYNLIKEANGSNNSEDPTRIVDDVTDDEFKALVLIHKPSDITSFKIVDVWTDDHTTCLGLQVNGINFGVWWMYETDDNDDPIIPKELRGSKLTPKLQQTVFDVLQQWLTNGNMAEEGGPRDSTVVDYYRRSDIKQKQVKDIISKNNTSGWEM